MYDKKTIMGIDMDADPAAGPGTDMPPEAAEEVTVNG